MTAAQSVEIGSERDVVRARGKGREIARDLGFGLADQTRVATAISELVRNVVQYAGGGICTYFDDSDQDSIRLRIEVQDDGPGISDLDRAMDDGFSTGGGLGAGLPGTKRLVDEFEIESRPGHTRISIVMAKLRS